jgi:hypothetical protein
MKKAAFAGAAIAALMSAGAAYAQSGYVGLSYQESDSGGSSSLDTTAVSGAFLLGEHFQANARYADLSSGGADYWAIDGFLFSRNDQSAYGGFLGYDTFESGSSSYDEWSIGGFGQWYHGNTTWTGQLGYADTEGEVHVIHIDGEGRHFVNDNFSFQGNLGYGDVDGSGGGSVNYWTGGIGAEWQFASAPISLYGGWQHVDIDGGGEADTLGLGARWNFGGGSLLDRNRSGAGFTRVTPTVFELELGGSGVTPR